MKLYYKPGACSLASHIALNEAGAKFDIEMVDTTTKKTASGDDFLSVNPLGYVPALQLDEGTVLVEGAAILQYVADQNPSSNLAPENATTERAVLQQYLNYTATELHKSFGILFSGKELSAANKDAGVANILKKLSFFENILLDDRSYLQGDTFTVADAYFFVVTSWTGFLGIDISSFPKTTAFLGRVAARPAVQASLKAEGLLK